MTIDYKRMRAIKKFKKITEQLAARYVKENPGKMTAGPFNRPIEVDNPFTINDYVDKWKNYAYLEELVDGENILNKYDLNKQYDDFVEFVETYYE